MNKICLCLVLLATAGCATGELEHNAAAESDEAWGMVVSGWGDVLGASLSEAEPPHVYWHDVTCLDDLPEFPLESGTSGCLGGRFNTLEGQRRIDLATPPSELVSESSFAHETLHWALFETDNNSDHDHTLDVWDELDTINQVLAEAGL